MRCLKARRACLFLSNLTHSCSHSTLAASASSDAGRRDWHGLLWPCAVGLDALQHRLAAYMFINTSTHQHRPSKHSITSSRPCHCPGIAWQHRTASACRDMLPQLMLALLSLMSLMSLMSTNPLCVLVECCTQCSALAAAAAAATLRHTTARTSRSASCQVFQPGKLCMHCIPSEVTCHMQGNIQHKQPDEPTSHPRTFLHSAAS